MCATVTVMCTTSRSICLALFVCSLVFARGQVGEPACERQNAVHYRENTRCLSWTQKEGYLNMFGVTCHS